MNRHPPQIRSRAAAGLDEAARQGRFALQVCTECGTVQYPCRDACLACLSEALEWRGVPSEGALTARTIVRVSAEPGFQSGLPLAIGLVRLDCGPNALCFLDAGTEAGGRVSLRLDLDAGGRALFHAAPLRPTDDAT